MAQPPQNQSTSSSPSKSSDDLLVGFAAGATIFQEGDTGDEMFIIESGEVELVKEFAGEERRLSSLGVGDFFGEISVLEEIPRTATARARTACRLLPIDPSTFDQLLRKHPEVTVRMLRKLTRRLREIDEETERAQEAAAKVLRRANRGPMKPIDPRDVAPSRATGTNPMAFSTAKLQPLDPATDDGTSTSASRILTSDAIPPELPPEPPTRPVGHLVHPGSGLTFPVAYNSKSVIGRFDPVSGKYPEINLTPIDGRRSLSRRHARVWSSDGRFFVREELGVANGTYVRGQRMMSGQDYEVFDGDALKLGLVELVFHTGPEGSGHGA